MDRLSKSNKRFGPRPATQREYFSVLIFSAAYLFFCLIYILWDRNYEFLLYIVVMSVIISAVCRIYRHAGLSRALLWGFSIWGLLHMVGGLIPIPSEWHKPNVSGVAYNWRIIPGYLKYDQAVHGFGVGLVTWLCWQVLASRLRSGDGSPLKPTLGMSILCAAAGMGFGSINEIVEFFAVLLLPETNVGGYHNTGWDLVSNLIGACIAVTFIHFIWERQSLRYHKNDPQDSV